MRILIIALLAGSALSAQNPVVDSLNVRYHFIESRFLQDETIFKIAVPPYLQTWEVMEQVRLAVQWPGDPPPDRPTTVYVFREGEGRGSVSGTGGVYIPGQGFRWDMGDWTPDTGVLAFVPRDIDKFMYNAVLDSLFRQGMDALAIDGIPERLKLGVAREFAVSPAQVDSVFYRVKWYVDRHGSGDRDSP